MGSTYDPKKNCRVGIMDESQFYSECSTENGDWFRSLIQAWEKAGGNLKWGAGGVGLRAPIHGKETGICFLAPAFRAKQDRLELACTALAKQIGDKRCDDLQDSLRQVAGDQVLGKSMLSIVQPGTLPLDKQKRLSMVLRDLM
jgi:hypothetical protein